MSSKFASDHDTITFTNQNFLNSFTKEAVII